MLTIKSGVNGLLREIRCMTEKVVLLAKRPQLGRVKTRLAATIGEEAALVVYKELLAHTFHALLETDINVAIYLTGRGEITIPRSFELKDQTNGDIGERMHHAIEDALKEANKVVLVGSDIPEISSAIISDAMSALSDVDVVLGPSEDGGYYLIGMKKANAHLFDNMEWSVATVFEETLKRCSAEKLIVHLCPTLYDLDDEKDLLKWKGKKINPTENSDHLS